MVLGSEGLLVEYQQHINQSAVCTADMSEPWANGITEQLNHECY